MTGDMSQEGTCDMSQVIVWLYGMVRVVVIVVVWHGFMVVWLYSHIMHKRMSRVTGDCMVVGYVWGFGCSCGVAWFCGWMVVLPHDA